MANDGGRSNLRAPWPKGISGNPNGRPKNLPITDAYRALSKMPVSKLPPAVIQKFKAAGIVLEEGQTLGETVAYVQFVEAIGGKAKTRAAQEIREAIEGKSVQRVELSGDEDNPLGITVKYISAKSQRKNSSDS